MSELLNDQSHLPLLNCVVDLLKFKAALGSLSIMEPQLCFLINMGWASEMWERLFSFTEIWR
jgi:hypothetical protein